MKGTLTMHIDQLKCIDLIWIMIQINTVKKNDFYKIIRNQALPEYWMILRNYC